MNKSAMRYIVSINPTFDGFFTRLIERIPHIRNIWSGKPLSTSRDPCQETDDSNNSKRRGGIVHVVLRDGFL